MSVEDVLRILLFAFLALTLGLFIVPGRRVLPRETVAVDFGKAFSVFLAGWISTELFGALAPSEWSWTEEVLHFSVLLLFAAWMNLRWRWALRRARGEG